MFYGTTGTRGIQSVKCCVVYHPATGVIVHVHRVVDPAGNPVTPDHKVREQALDLAARNGRDISQFEAAVVPADAIAPGYVYQVDAKTKHLRRGEATPGLRPPAGPEG